MRSVFDSHTQTTDYINSTGGATSEWKLGNAVCHHISSKGLSNIHIHQGNSLGNNINSKYGWYGDPILLCRAGTRKGGNIAY